ncbi:MAG: hypothetical protein HY897_06205 [Deltaproteobacteria bacterium]|nr:hypothetical protein [Deltaproteobacteria bacterium]
MRGAEVAVTADESFGGAVVSVLWGGAEFVNRHDTGRLLQVAWNVDGENETLNPTEGGSINAKSTVFLYGSVTGKTLTTSCHPAYWLPPGYGGSRAQTVTTADKLTKAITADFGGNPHVLKYDTNIELAADTNLFSGEVPTIYLPREFNSFFTYDAETGALIDRTVDVNPAGGCIDPTQFDDLRPRHGGIVAATSNGGFALALYGSNPPNSGFGMPEGCYAFAACSFTHLSGAGPLGDATTKLVAKSRISQLAAGAHSWTSYVVVGSRDQVTATMSELWRNGN